MKCQILFAGKNEKNISNCRLLKFLHSMLSVSSQHVFVWIMVFLCERVIQLGIVAAVSKGNLPFCEVR